MRCPPNVVAVYVDPIVVRYLVIRADDPMSREAKPNEMCGW